MSDYDAAFSAASGAINGAKPVDEYDAVIQAVTPKVRATKEPEISREVGKSVNANLTSIPRQLGLTARYAMEGPAQALQVVTEPVKNLITDPLLRATGLMADGRPTLTGLVTGQAPRRGSSRSLGEIASGVADWMGLPKPESANERVIGDASRLVAGAGGMGAAASLGSSLPGMTGTVLSGLSAAPMQQLGSAAGAGLLGGASREAGGGPITQAAASLVGGVGGGLAPGAVQSAAGAVRRAFTPAMAPPQLDVELTSILGRAGTDYSQLPENARRALRTELASSLQAGKELDPQALRRFADFAAVGVTPTRGMVSQNPVQITREQNLAKIAANSADGQLQGLPLMQNQNNQALIRNLNNLGGRSEVDSLAAGRVISDRIAGNHAALNSAEQTAWDAAKGMPGYKQPIFPDGLNAAMREVGDEALTGYLPKQITDYMAAFQTGQQPFTPQHYKNLRSMLSGELAKGGNEASAARAAIRGLDSSQMRALTETGRDIGSAPVTSGMAAQLRASDAQPQSAIDAVNQARAATAAKYRYEESSPLVRSALSGGRTADPEKLTQSFVINGTLNDAQAVAREVGPQGVQTIRDALATHIKKQALSGASDETGKVSQSALNAALRKIGDEKLRLFFSPEEVASLKTNGRVAAYMQSQPVGSAVNNSNSGALLLGRGLDSIDNKLKLVPFGGLAKMGVTDPLRNINIAISQRQAQNVIPGLLTQGQSPSMAQSLILPGLATGGLLLSPP